jgi:hypothetical protein
MTGYDTEIRRRPVRVGYPDGNESINPASVVAGCLILLSVNTAMDSGRVAVRRMRFLPLRRDTHKIKTQKAGLTLVDSPHMVYQACIA